jgi:hypothetical protein
MSVLFDELNGAVGPCIQRVEVTENGDGQFSQKHRPTVYPGNSIGQRGHRESFPGRYREAGVWSYQKLFRFPAASGAEISPRATLAFKKALR